MATVRKRHLTAKEYLAIERQAPWKSECAGRYLYPDGGLFILCV